MISKSTKPCQLTDRIIHIICIRILDIYIRKFYVKFLQQIINNYVTNKYSTNKGLLQYENNKFLSKII